MRKSKLSLNPERKRNVFLIFLLLVATICHSQNSNEGKEMYLRFPIKSFLGNQVIGLPLQNLTGALNPCFFIGSEIYYNKNTKHRIDQTCIFRSN
jgi:hypothetical protein